MITNVNVLALFAESIRQEATGQHTFVGVFDDIAEFQSFPATFSQLSMFVTVSTLISDPFTPRSFKVRLSNEEVLMSHNFPDDIKKHQEEAISKRNGDNDSGWIYLRLMINLLGIKLTESTQIFIEIEDENGNTAYSNSLNVKLKRPATTVVSPTDDTE